MSKSRPHFIRKRKSPHGAAASVAGHGGKISVSAAAERGTIFEFELPAAERQRASQNLAA